MTNQMQEAIRVFNQGGIVIFPTDTAFGIGCRVDKKDAVERLYTIRQRPHTQPVSLLVSDKDMAKKYVIEIPTDVDNRLIRKFWPGALTIVLHCRTDMVPQLVRGGGETIGVRMPDHEVLLHIIKCIGVPILGPSANLHGKKTPFRKTDLDPELVKKVDYVLGGVCQQNTVSTVIDCTVVPWKILREGVVKIIV